MNFTESVVEQAAFAWFERLGWFVRRGFRIRNASGELGAKRFIADLRA